MSNPENEFELEQSVIPNKYWDILKTSCECHSIGKVIIEEDLYTDHHAETTLTLSNKDWQYIKVKHIPEENEVQITFDGNAESNSILKALAIAVSTHRLRAKQIGHRHKGEEV